MNKAIVSIFFALILAASAFALVPFGSIIQGKPDMLPDIIPGDAQAIYADMWDNLALSERQSLVSYGRALKIGGATCSEDPDFSGEFVPTDANANTICKKNTAHIGISWEMYALNVNGGVESYIGRKEIEAGETACFTLASRQYPYYWEYYYCDVVEDTACKDSDEGKEPKSYGEVTVTGSGQIRIWRDACSGGKLLERYCDADNTAATMPAIDCKTYGDTFACTGGECKAGAATTAGADYKQCYGTEAASHVYWYSADGTRLGRAEYCSASQGDVCQNIGTKDAKCVASSVSPEGTITSTTGTLQANVEELEYIPKGPGVAISSVRATITLRNVADKSAAGMLSLEMIDEKEWAAYGSREALPNFASSEMVQCGKSDDKQVRFVLKPGEVRRMSLTTYPNPNVAYKDVQVHVVPDCYYNLIGEGWNLQSSQNRVFDYSALIKAGSYEKYTVAFIPAKVTYATGVKWDLANTIELNGPEREWDNKCSGDRTDGQGWCEDDHRKIECTCNSYTGTCEDKEVGCGTQYCVWAADKLPTCAAKPLNLTKVTCGDDTCNGDETCETCEKDCGTCEGPNCGDGTCNGDETTETCAVDCACIADGERDMGIFSSDCCSGYDCRKGFICGNNCKNETNCATVGESYLEDPNTLISPSCCEGLCKVDGVCSECGNATNYTEGKAFINPDDDTMWCIAEKDKTENQSCADFSAPRKDLIYLKDLANIEEPSLWAKMTGGYIKDGSNPICLYSLGNAQCKEGGVCLQARNSESSTLKENKMVYDAIEPLVNTNLQTFTEVTTTIMTLGINKLGEWLFETKTPSEKITEAHGVCTYKDRGIMAQFKSWLMKNFNLGEKGALYAMYGIIAFGVIVLIILLKPPKPKYQ